MITVDFDNFPTLHVREACYAEIDPQGNLYLFKARDESDVLGVVASGRWMHYTLTYEPGQEPTPAADTPDESSST